MSAPLVQSVKGESGSGSALNVGPTTFTAGNFLSISVASNTGAAITVSDSTHSVTATLIDRGTAGSAAIGGAVYYIPNITGGSTTIAIAGATGGLTAIIQEWSGLATSTPVDQHTTGTATTGTAHATGTTSATTNAIDLVFLFDASATATNTNPTSATTGYTMLTGANDRESDGTNWWTGATARKDVTSTGTQVGTFNWTSNAYFTIIAALKEAAAAGSDIPVPLHGSFQSPLYRM